VAKAADGHFWARADVDGADVRFLVDTGASVVMLTPADAERLGVDPKELRYTRPVATAAGDQRGAAVMLDHVAIAGARVDHVEAMVIPKGLPASLLGMSYLGRLSSFKATPQSLVLDR
jgi:aspartyl protease family protein